jgi:cellulose biosynthesis protein BcsQ
VAQNDVIEEAVMWYLQRERRLPQGQDALSVGVLTRKGGVGKTEMSKWIAYWMGARSFVTNLIEVDDNIRLTRSLVGRKPNEVRFQQLQPMQTVYGLMRAPLNGMGDAPIRVYVTGRPIADKMLKYADLDDDMRLLHRDEATRIVNGYGWNHPSDLALLPGHRHLREFEGRVNFANLATTGQSPFERFDPYQQLRQAFGVIHTQADVLVVDTPPSLITVQYNVLMALDLVILIVDFDPDSIEDYYETMGFYEQVCDTCRSMNLQPPHILGIIYNKYHADERHDRTLLEAYTKGIDGKQPLIPFPTLGVIPFDDHRVKYEQANRTTIFVTAPASPIAQAAAQMCGSIERAIGLSPYAASA